jgi:portal protein
MSEPEVYSPDEGAALESRYAGLIPLEGKAGGLDLDSRGGFFLVPEGRSTKSGVTVTTRTAMEIAAVMACATVVSEDMGKMPLQLFRWDTEDKSRRTATGQSTREPLHPLAKLLETRPNQYMTAQAFKETLTLHAMLWGGGYAYKVRDEKAVVRELWPFVPGLPISGRARRGQPPRLPGSGGQGPQDAGPPDAPPAVLAGEGRHQGRAARPHRQARARRAGQGRRRQARAGGVRPLPRRGEADELGRGPINAGQFNGGRLRRRQLMWVHETCFAPPPHFR